MCAAPSPPDGQFFVSVEAVRLLVIYDHFFALQQHADPAIVKPMAHCLNRLHLLANVTIGRRPVTPDSFRIDANKSTCPALRDIMIRHRF